MTTLRERAMGGGCFGGIVGALESMKSRPDSTPLLGKIDGPTLIIHGEEDHLIPPQEAQSMHTAISDSTLYLIPTAGHLPNLEQPERFNQAVREFMKKL